LVHNPVVLNEEIHVQELLGRLKKRQKLKLIPFPFSSFQLELLNLSPKTLKNFGLTVGPQVEQYFIHQGSQINKASASLRNGGKVAILLSHSPQLSKLEINCDDEFELTEEDCLRLPSTFSRLSVIGISGGQFSEYPTRPNGPNPLLDAVVHRAPHLKLFKISGYDSHQRSDMRIIRFLVQNRPNNLPDFSLEEPFLFDSNPLEKIAFIQEIMNSNLKFKNINIDLYLWRVRIGVEPRMVRTVCSWLKTQSSSLTDLRLSFKTAQGQITSFQFPILPVLRNLTIVHSWAILPSFINLFPALEKLSLEYYSDHEHDHGIFGNSTMPFAKKLLLPFQESSISDRPWKVISPNLTSLRLALVKYEIVRPTFQFILTHLSQLVHLDLNLHFNYRGRGDSNSSDIWDVLTGKAPRSCDDLTTLLADVLVQNVKAAEEPVNGIYSIPSLRNMRG